MGDDKAEQIALLNSIVTISNELLTKADAELVEAERALARVSDYEPRKELIKRQIADAKVQRNSLALNLRLLEQNVEKLQNE